MSIDDHVREGVGSIDEPAYFITYRFRDDATRFAALDSGLQLLRAIRDALLARDDEHYPFIRNLGPEGWRRVFAL